MRPDLLSGSIDILGELHGYINKSWQNTYTTNKSYTGELLMQCYPCSIVPLLITTIDRKVMTWVCGFRGITWLEQRVPSYIYIPVRSLIS